MQLSKEDVKFEAPQQEAPPLEFAEKDEPEIEDESVRSIETGIERFEQANENSLADEIASLHQAIVDRYKLEQTKGRAEEFTQNLKASLENVGDKKLFSAFGVTVTARDAIILTASQALGHAIPVLLATTNINGALASVLIGGAIGGMSSGLRAGKMVEREYLRGAGWEAKINEVDDPKVQLEMIKFLLSDPESKKYFKGNAEEAWGLLALYQTIAKEIETQEIVDIASEQEIDQTSPTAREVIANHLKDKSDEQRNEFWRAFGNGAIRAMAFSLASYGLGTLLSGTPAYGAGNEQGQNAAAQGSRIGAQIAVAGTLTAVALSYTKWGRKMIGKAVEAGKEKLSELVDRRRGRTTETDPATPAQPRDREVRIQSFAESLVSLADESERMTVAEIVTRLDEASQLMKKTKVEKKELDPLAADLIQIGDVLREKGTFKENTRGHQTYSQEKVRPNLERQYTVGLVTLPTNGEVHINARDDKGNLVFWTPSTFLKNVDLHSFRPVEPETDDGPPVLNENLLEPDAADAEGDADRTAEYIENVRKFEPIDAMPDAAMRDFKDAYLIGKVGGKPVSLTHISTPDDSETFRVETADLGSGDRSFSDPREYTADQLNDLMDHSDGKTYEIYGDPSKKIGPPEVGDLLIETLGTETPFDGSLEEATGKYNQFDIITIHNGERIRLSHVVISDPERKIADVTSTSLTRREDPTTSQWSVAALIRLTEGQVEIHVNPESEPDLGETIARLTQIVEKHQKDDKKDKEDPEKDIDYLMLGIRGRKITLSEKAQRIFKKLQAANPQQEALHNLDLQTELTFENISLVKNDPRMALSQPDTGGALSIKIDKYFESICGFNGDQIEELPEPAEYAITKMTELSKQYATKPTESIKQEIEELATVAKGDRLVLSETGQKKYEENKKKKSTGELAKVDPKGEFKIGDVDYSKKIPRLKLIQEATGAEIFEPLSENFFANFETAKPETATENPAPISEPLPSPAELEEQNQKAFEQALSAFDKFDKYDEALGGLGTAARSYRELAVVFSATDGSRSILWIKNDENHFPPFTLSALKSSAASAGWEAEFKWNDEQLDDYISRAAGESYKILVNPDSEINPEPPAPEPPAPPSIDNAGADTDPSPDIPAPAPPTAPASEPPSLPPTPPPEDPRNPLEDLFGNPTEDLVEKALGVGASKFEGSLEEAIAQHDDVSVVSKIAGRDSVVFHISKDMSKPDSFDIVSANLTNGETEFVGGEPTQLSNADLLRRYTGETDIYIKPDSKIGTKSEATSNGSV